MRKNIIYLAILFLLIFTTCSKNKVIKEYYENGSLHKCLTYKKSEKTQEIIFNSKGDTLEVLNYMNGLMQGTCIGFQYEPFKIKRVFTFDKGLENGPGYEYADDKLRFKFQYINGEKEGRFYGYFHSGEIKYFGDFYNDTLMFLNELDISGNLKSINNALKYIIYADQVINFQFILYENEYFSDSIDVQYVFYKIEEQDTIKINKENT